MTHIEQVAVGQECPFCGARDAHYQSDYGDESQFVCAVCDARGPMKRNYDDALTAWNTRVASTRPISNEEVRDAIEWMESIVDDDQHAENYDEADEGRKVIAALEHLSAENDRKDTLLEEIGQQFMKLQADAIHLSAREAEARETMAGLVNAWEALPGNRHYSPARIEAWLRADMKDAVGAIRNWLKAGEMEHAE